MHLLDFTTITLCLTFLPSALANVEKVIFVPSPPDPPHPLQFPPNLLRLSPDNPRLYTALDLNANINGGDRGGGGGGEESAIWVVLETLIPGKRYEVRIVWAATEPAEFKLGVFPAVEAGEMGMGVSATVESVILGEEEEEKRAKEGKLRTSRGTIMYLRVLAKKDQYNPDPVMVELVLDSFLWNILPESLLHIGVVVVLVAGTAWWVSMRADRWLSMVARQQRAMAGRKVN